MRKLNLAGEVYGNLTAVSLAKIRKKHSIWLCLCVCGNYKEVSLANLRTGHTRSCGCIAPKHGLTTSEQFHPEYWIWKNMRERCLKPRCRGWRWYGARGITVCERWKNSFPNFVADMGPRPPGLTLDRINNDGNYEPGNCRWVTWQEQFKNKRQGNRYKSSNSCEEAMRVLE